MSYMKVEFPGGLKVDARSSRHLIKTDQSGSEPSPFELFLASLATCGGIFALSFCNSKVINTEGMDISMNLEMNKQTGMIDKIIYDVKLPDDFPAKYENALIKSIDLCSVKKHMMTPPEFEVKTTF